MPGGLCISAPSGSTFSPSFSRLTPVHSLDGSQPPFWNYPRREWAAPWRASSGAGRNARFLSFHLEGGHGGGVCFRSEPRSFSLPTGACGSLGQGCPGEWEGRDSRELALVPRTRGSSRSSRALARSLEFSLDFPLGPWVLGSSGRGAGCP